MKGCSPANENIAAIVQEIVNAEALRQLPSGPSCPQPLLTFPLALAPLRDALSGGAFASSRRSSSVSRLRQGQGCLGARIARRTIPLQLLCVGLKALWFRIQMITSPVPFPLLPATMPSDKRSGGNSLARLHLRNTASIPIPGQTVPSFPGDCFADSFR